MIEGAALIIGIVAALLFVGVWRGIFKVGAKNMAMVNIVLLATAVALPFDILGAGTYVNGLLGSGPALTAAGGTETVANGASQPQGFQASLAEACGNTKSSTVTFNLHNALNTTGDEVFDTTMHVWKLNSDGTIGEKAATQTDTTAGTATLDCGFEYKGVIIGAGADEGDNSNLKGVLSGPAKIESGDLRFSVGSANPRVEFSGAQHGVWESRAFDVLNNDFFDDSNDAGASSTDYETGSPVFNSTGNATIAVGVAGEVHAKFELRATRVDTDVNDKGWCALFDLNPTVWDKPTVWLNGAVASETKGSLSSNVQREYGSIAEYAYCSDSKIEDSPSTFVEIDVFALSGVQPAALPADDINMTLVMKSNFLSTDGVRVLTDYVDDSSATNAIFAPQSVVLDVS